jgi:hypothetical protein
MRRLLFGVIAMVGLGLIGWFGWQLNVEVLGATMKGHGRAAELPAFGELVGGLVGTNAVSYHIWHRHKRQYVAAFSGEVTQSALDAFSSVHQVQKWEPGRWHALPSEAKSLRLDPRFFFLAFTTNDWVGRSHKAANFQIELQYQELSRRFTMVVWTHSIDGADAPNR